MNKMIISGLVAIIFMVGCTQKIEESSVNKIENIAVITASVESYLPSKKYSGAMQANQEANLGAMLPGRVEKIFKEIGEDVQKGDLIAELSGEFLAQAKIEYKTYKKDYERMSRLHEKGSVSELDYDHIKAKYEATKEKYEMVKKSTEIRALFNGTIADLMVNEGENYLFVPSLEIGYSHTPGIVKLVNTDQIKIEIDVNEKDISDIKIGQKATITGDAFVDETFEAVVSNIKPTLSHLTRSATVELKLNNSDHRIMPGMFAHVELYFPSKEEVMIPRQCIFKLNGTGESFVYIIENNVAHRRVIKILADLSDVVAVANVNVGERVVAEGKTKIFDGDSVSVK